uniref:Putative secreted protein n=1 Tax=Amblyomma triste TaxID=251400 RepID=A0A023G0R1_AMBTT
MEVRPLLIACFLAAVAARSPFYGDPRWRCISRAPGDNPGELHVAEKPDTCIYFCSTDNTTWNFGLYLDKTPCKVEGKAGVCQEGECVESEAPGLDKEKKVEVGGEGAPVSPESPAPSRDHWKT